MIKRLNNKLYIFLLVAGLILTPAGCGPASNTGSTQANSSQPSTITVSASASTASASASTASASEHSQAALALKKLLDDMSLKEKVLQLVQLPGQAFEENAADEVEINYHPEIAQKYYDGLMQLKEQFDFHNKVLFS